MAEYIAPLKDMQFVLQEIADLSSVAALPPFGDAQPDLVDSILEEAGKFASGVLSPLNWSGDQNGTQFNPDSYTVTPAAGFPEAYQQFVESGWNGLACDPDFGGQGMPDLVATAVSEMWCSANMAFSLCPMLTQGAINAIAQNATDTLKAQYLPKMISGEWTGTMNLTEPQAGSDLAAVRSKAIPDGEHYLISGQKIFITWGDHEMTENVIHLVLARLPDAPAGVKGISLFIVPKYLLNADGSIGARNDVRCVSIEHKLGIHASPTCTMAFGDTGGAIGYLVGEANRGLEYMFVMMNHARLNVGLEGIAISERAYQRARDYARERVQSRDMGSKDANGVAIIHHADIRRMLLSMRSQTEAMRALSYFAAAALDKAHTHPDATEQAWNQALVDLLIPIVKGWCTEQCIEVASLGVQVHGGMGFVEETGAAQYYRDARITTIYEGTTGIQALDLIGRKIVREQGVTMKALLEEMRSTVQQLGVFTDIQAALQSGVNALANATEWLLTHYGANPKAAAAGAVAYLKLAGTVFGGWLMAKSALAAARKLSEGQDDEFYGAKIVTARFFATHSLPLATAYAAEVSDGADSTLALALELF